MRARGVSSMLLLLGVLACGPKFELPEGWEHARQVEISQAPATDGCAGEAPTLVSVGANDGQLEVVVDDLVLGCAEAYEGFVRGSAADGYELLLQPVDMHPDALAGCVCASRLRAEVGPGDAGTQVEVFWRPSFTEQPNSTPSSLGVASSEVGIPYCDVLPACGINELVCPPLEGDAPSYGCIIVGCETPVCLTDEEACVSVCGEPLCAILESDPAQVACE